MDAIFGTINSALGAGPVVAGLSFVGALYVAYKLDHVRLVSHVKSIASLTIRKMHGHTGNERRAHELLALSSIGQYGAVLLFTSHDKCLHSLTLLLFLGTSNNTGRPWSRFTRCFSVQGKISRSWDNGV